MLGMQERLAYNFGKEIRRRKQYYYAEHYAHYLFRLHVAWEFISLFTSPALVPATTESTPWPTEKIMSSSTP